MPIYLNFETFGTIPIVREQRDWVGGSRKMVIFAYVQYCINADIVHYSAVGGWVQKCADVIYG